MAASKNFGIALSSSMYKQTHPNAERCIVTLVQKFVRLLALHIVNSKQFTAQIYTIQSYPWAEECSKCFVNDQISYLNVLRSSKTMRVYEKWDDLHDLTSLCASSGSSLADGSDLNLVQDSTIICSRPPSLEVELSPSPSCLTPTEILTTEKGSSSISDVSQGKVLRFQEKTIPAHIFPASSNATCSMRKMATSSRSVCLW